MKDQNTLNIINYVYSFVCLIGLIGNILSIIVFSRQVFARTIFSTYFRIMALFDLLTLILRIDYFLTSFEINSLSRLSNISCKIVMFFIYLLPCLSLWTLVLISLDRFVSIVIPTRFLFRKKQIYQLLAILIISIYNILLCFPIIFTSNIGIPSSNYTNFPECDNKSYLIYCTFLVRQ